MNYSALASLLGRIGLAAIFILAGWNKIGGYEGTAAYMESMGVPGILLPAVIALELLGGIAILVGLLTRWVAIALAGFSVMAGILFHFNFADQMQSILFMKNLAIAGGFLILAANGPGSYSIDALRKQAA